MQSLLVLQSLGSMLGHRPDLYTPSAVEELVDRAVDDGFDGLGIVADGPFVPRVAIDLVRERGLAWEAQCYSRTVEDLEPVLELAGSMGAHHVNMQPDVRPTSVAECVRLLEGWQALADAAGVDLMIETHRNRMTNDLLFTLEILAELPSLKLTGDISHYVVAREMWLPLAADNDAWMTQILDRSWAFHGRVGSSEQIQLPLHFSRAGAWVEQFRSWWDYGFTAWRAKAPADATLSFLCELVPAPYALTDADGNEFSDRWEESCRLKDIVRALWVDQGSSPLAPGDALPAASL